MYNVSNGYLDQIKKSYAYKRALRGMVGHVNFTHADILSGSFSISNSCSSENEVRIGTVNVGMLKTTFRRDLIPKEHWKGAVISVQDGLYIEAETRYEYVPMGVFTVDDAEEKKNGVEITAYDNMIRFDKAWNIATTIGSPYSILAMLCDDCNVQLGMTRADIEALPNGTATISLYSENDCETYRDVLFWLSQLLCCFATIGRDNKLYLRTYGDTPVDTITDKSRFDDNAFATYATAYSGISLVDTDDEELIYVSEGEDSQLTYSLGANPFMQYGTMSTRKQQMLNILRQLKKIKYTPFSTGMLYTPAYDLGDVIRFTGDIADTGLICCIMDYEYDFEKYVAEGYGSDPALANARNKTDKDISGLRSKTNKNGIQFYTFKNAERAVVPDGKTKQLIYIRFTTMNARQVTFQAEILADADITLDEVAAKVQYYLDGSLIEDYQPVETWSEDGKHIISLYYMIDVEPNTLYRWQVMLNSDGGTITVPAEHARGTIWGQGLVAISKWDGYIDCEDTVATFRLGSINVADFDDEADARLITPILIEVEENIECIGLDDIAVNDFADYVIMNKTSIYYEGLTWDDLVVKDWGEVLDEHLW